MASPLMLAEAGVIPQGPGGRGRDGGSERTYVKLLAFLLGFSQGCGICFYVGAGGYFSAVTGDAMFFVHACTFFYWPPILVAVLQLLLDHRFDQITVGIRTVIRFRIYFSSIGVAIMLLLAAIFTANDPEGDGHLKQDAFTNGIILGCFAAALYGSACALFGAVDPRLVAYLVLGQTVAGVYANVVAMALQFEPGCERWRASAFFIVAAVTVAVITVVYFFANYRNLLESAYAHHEARVSSSRLSTSTPRVGRSVVGSGVSDVELHVEAACGPGPFGFPWFCWSMALAQATAIAMNMSLTPLSNQVARDDLDLSQELVLLKLFSDFCGRSVFLMLPRPSKSMPWSLPKGILAQGVVVGVVQLLRLPLWFCVYLWAVGSDLPVFLEDRSVLLWSVWLPLISTGALSSSWASLLAVAWVPEDLKSSANLLMSFSVYLGFFIGIMIALLSV